MLCGPSCLSLSLSGYGGFSFSIKRYILEASTMQSSFEALGLKDVKMFTHQVKEEANPQFELFLIIFWLWVQESFFLCWQAEGPPADGRAVNQVFD